jgi:hypothetical protein
MGIHDRESCYFYQFPASPIGDGNRSSRRSTCDLRGRRLASEPGQLITLKISAQIEISARLA